MATQEEQIIKLFADNGGRFETRDIPYSLAFEYRRAISMLRKRGIRDGFRINAKKLTQNNWLYTWVRAPMIEPEQVKTYQYDQQGQGLLL